MKMGGQDFEYKGDRAKTDDNHDAEGFFTVGDIPVKRTYTAADIAEAEQTAAAVVVDVVAPEQLPGLGEGRHRAAMLATRGTGLQPAPEAVAEAEAEAAVDRRRQRRACRSPGRGRDRSVRRVGRGATREQEVPRARAGR
mgnify:CR=1 FL=1